MEAFLVSTGIVALAEMGDKTQLLALVLAARFRAPIPIILGILLSTLANHFIAGAVGHWLTALFSPTTLSWILAACFLAMAIWILIPDKLDDDESSAIKKFGPFVATFIAFFLAEMGDKTQIATVMLAAQYNSLFWVVAGTTVGMMIANVPAVLLGNFSAEKLPLRAIHIVAALLFVAMAGFAIYQAITI
ncbi:TMEM165/GDT1 family protein [Entomomonas sp. E2T0]|uniref:TMEM165/GDT1 family protein n=1 Tax=Entomomonas sp. E2T0 TaxID=2930213 RepID=UPI0022282C50|nr:TMEM165/GDT1 family protein [Entomomonas sp. E2T0]UYZ83986.1 TMEM165/GDT1 family protein [Entomomonas sp. E2T0]